MTAKASIRQSDLDRMAVTAKKRGVPVEMLDERGRIFRVYPTVEDLKHDTALDPELAYGGNSLEEWRNRRGSRPRRRASGE